MYDALHMVPYHRGDGGALLGCHDTHPSMRVVLNGDGHILYYFFCHYFSELAILKTVYPRACPGYNLAMRR